MRNDPTSVNHIAFAVFFETRRLFRFQSPFGSGRKPTDCIISINSQSSCDLTMRTLFGSELERLNWLIAKYKNNTADMLKAII